MGWLHTDLPQSNDRPHQESKKIQPGAATTRKRKDAEAASNHRYSPVNAGWTEVSAPPGSLPHEPEQLGTLVDQLALPAPLLDRHLPNALVEPSARGSGGWKQETCSNRVSSAKGTPAGHQGGKHRERGPGQEESQLGPPQPRGTDDERKLKNRSRRPDRPGQEESSNRLDGEAARRRSSSPAGEPRGQRPTLEDQHPAADGERQPSAAEQRAASQTLPPLHSPPIPSSFPPALPSSHQPSHSPVHRALAS